jgi:hypothetical protein
MVAKSLSAKSEALRKRQRLAAEEGSKALAEYKAGDLAIRKNMARLRALRLAREAEAASLPSPKPSKASTRQPKGTR